MNMKKEYVAPQLEIVCFAPVERLASVIEFDSLLDLTTGGNKVEIINPSGGDVSIDLG